jgi:hypothetical protein
LYSSKAEASNCPQDYQRVLTTVVFFLFSMDVQCASEERAQTYHPAEASNASLICHPDDPSIARGGRTSDSFAQAKPVPVSETAQRSLCFCRHAIAANSYSEGNNSKTGTGGAYAPLSEVLPLLAMLGSSG